MERALHGFDDKELAQVTVRGGTREAVDPQQHRPHAKARFWSKAATPQTPDSQAGTWVGKARRLPILRYPTEQPDGPAVKLSLVYADEGGKQLARMDLAFREGLPPRYGATRAGSGQRPTRSVPKSSRPTSTPSCADFIETICSLRA